MVIKVRLTEIDRDPISFNFVNQSKNLFLECPRFGKNAALYRIGAQMLAEDAPLNRRNSGCCLCKPKWVVARVLVEGRAQDVLIKVADVVQKWQLKESDVRRECDENFSDLARGVLQKTAEESVGLHEDNDWKVQPVNGLDDGVFINFKRFLDVATKNAAIDKVVDLLRKNWGEIQMQISREKASWRIAQTGSSGSQNVNVMVNLYGIYVECFKSDGSVWLHLNCGEKYPLVLDLSSGQLYRVKKIDGSLYEIAKRFEMVGKKSPNVEKIRVSFLSDGSRVYQPFFRSTLSNAQGKGWMLKQGQDLLVNGWKSGLQALHTGGIAMQEISMRHFLLDIGEDDETLTPVLAYSERAIISDLDKAEGNRAEDLAKFGIFMGGIFPDLAI